MKSVMPVRLLRNDIKKVNGLFAQAKSSEVLAPEMRRGVLRELCMFLDVQVQMEKNVLYPVIEATPGGSLAVEQSSEKQTEVRQWLHKVRNSPPFAENMDELISELFEAVSFHNSILESQVFPLLDVLPEAELIRVGQKINHYKEKMFKSDRYANSQSNIVQNPKGGEQMRKLKAA